MESEILAVQEMTEGLKSSGMPEAQANATVRAIAEGISTFAVTRDVLREELQRELAPIHARIDSLEFKIEGKIDSLSGRMFLLMIAVLTTMGAAVTAVIVTLIQVLRTV